GRGRGRGGAFVDGDEHALRDRKRRGIAAGRLQRLLQDRHRGLELGDARSARAHPAVGERSGPAQRIRVADAHPQRRGRPARRPRRPPCGFPPGGFSPGGGPPPPPPPPFLPPPPPGAAPPPPPPETGLTGV